MKIKFFSFLSIFLVLVSFATALEFGGIISNSTGMSGEFENLGLDQSNSLGLWLKAPLNDSGSNYFATEGSYSFSYEGVEPSITKNQLDLGLFKGTFVLPLENNGSLRFDVGRITAFDSTGFIFSQYSDGLQVSFSNPNFSISFLGSYTGLLNAHSTTYYMTDEISKEYDETALYPLAPKFIITGLSAICPSLFANQSLLTEFFGFWDLEETGFNRIFATLGLNGPITNSIYYIFSSTLGYNKGLEKYNGASNMTKFEISYYPNFLNSSFTYSAIYASGNSKGLKAFVPFNQISPDVSGNYAYSGIFKTGLAATFQFNPSFLLTFGTDIIAKSSVESTDKIKMDGFQWTINSRYLILSDLELSLGIGQFAPVASSDSLADFFANILLVVSF